MKNKFFQMFLVKEKYLMIFLLIIRIVRIDGYKIKMPKKVGIFGQYYKEGKLELANTLTPFYWGSFTFMTYKFHINSTKREIYFKSYGYVVFIIGNIYSNSTFTFKKHIIW
jgi:hypothetical protein